MYNDNIDNILTDRGIKPTANRILVMKELMKASNPVNLADLEVLLELSMDKASIFRVLELFAEKDVAHVIEDGCRSLKYELCHSGTSAPAQSAMVRPRQMWSNSRKMILPSFHRLR